MRRVFMMPTLEAAKEDDSNSINQIVTVFSKYLPEFGYEFTNNVEDADILAGHAGQNAYGELHVAHCHGLYPTAYPGSDRWHWGANASVVYNLTHAKRITVPSQWVADILRRDMHIEPHVIGWGIDPDEWVVPENHGGYVLWNKTRSDAVCDPTPVMNLAKRRLDVPFISTFGEPASNVHLCGRKIFSEMKSLIQGAMIYAATTKETFGIGILEAMACGIPVLGYNWGGVSDIVKHGVTGFLAEPGDIDGLVEGLQYCLDNREILSKNARAVSKGYSWREVCRKIAEVYDLSLVDGYKKKVSVVIPCHNYGRFVGQTITSVLEQHFSADDMEIIIINDGSTDDSAYVLREFEERFPDVIRVITHEQAEGVSEARNHGIREASGKYITCIDADDMLGHSHFLLYLSDAMDKDNSLGITFTSIRMMDAEGNLGNVSTWPDGWNYDYQIQKRNQIPTCCMFRKEAWRKAGGYDKIYEPAEDARLWTIIGSIGYRAEHVFKEGAFVYRMHPNSLSSEVRTGKKPEPDWTYGLPWIKTGERPLACSGKPPMGSWPVRNYDQPLVTVIIPVGPGHERIVIDALRSIEQQSETRWECLVIWNSPEKPDIPFPWAKIIHIPGNGRAGLPRNYGVALAKTSLVFFLDADDVALTDCLRDMLRLYDKSGGDRYVYPDWISYSKSGVYEQHTTPEYSQQEMFRKSSMHSINVLIDKQWILDVGGFDVDLPAWEDTDLFLKLAANGYCGVRLPVASIVYRYNTGSLREIGFGIKDELLDLFKTRYQESISGGFKVCCGNKQIAVTPPPAPIGETVTEGESVRVEFTGQFVPESRIELYGPVTGTYYGRRKKGDIFLIWKDDVVPDRFIPVKSAVAVLVPKTVIPPQPVLMEGVS